jgi:hypothetical protein
MVQKNCSVPFNFYCCTEDPSGLRSEINVIPLPNKYTESFWWKFWIVSQEFPIRGKCIYIDLDTVIQNDIREICEFDSEEDLYVLKAQWRHDKVHRLKVDQTNTNSSIMIWDNSRYTTSELWDRFNLDPEYYMLKYPGNDDFFEKEFPGKIKTLPIHWVYCRVWGYDDTDPDRGRFAPDSYIDIWNIRLQLFRMPDKMICMFNGIRDNEGIDSRIYQGFEHYWSD